MTLTILSPSATVVSEQVESLTVPGGAGRFTVLQNHAAIISTLTGGKVTWPGGELEIAGGILNVTDNEIDIFI